VAVVVMKISVSRCNKLILVYTNFLILVSYRACTVSVWMDKRSDFCLVQHIANTQVSCECSKNDRLALDYWLLRELLLVTVCVVIVRNWDVFLRLQCWSISSVICYRPHLLCAHVIQLLIVY